MFKGPLLKIFALAAAALLLNACDDDQLPLNLAPGFYASSFAYDAKTQRYMVGSYRNGEIALLSADGKRLGSLRNGVAGASNLKSAAVKLAFDERSRRLWVLYGETIEVIEVDRAAPALRFTLQPLGRRFVDLSLDAEGKAYVLDAAYGEVLRVDATHRQALRVATLPEASQAPGHCADGDDRAVDWDGGAVLRVRDENALIVASGGSLIRIDLDNGRQEPLRTPEPMAKVTQLLRDESSGDVIAIHAYNAGLTRLTLDASARAVQRQERVALRVEGPFSAMLRDGQLQVLLGSLRHHPAFCGDARPSRAPRIVTARLSAPTWQVAQERAAAPRMQ